MKGLGMPNRVWCVVQPKCIGQLIPPGKRSINSSCLFELSIRIELYNVFLWLSSTFSSGSVVYRNGVKLDKGTAPKRHGEPRNRKEGESGENRTPASRKCKLRFAGVIERAG